MSDLEIQVFKSNKDKIKQIPNAQKGILLKYPFSLLVIGRSGSGKTNAVANLFMNKNMYKDYFHDIIYISPTGNTDQLVIDLELPKENIITNVTIDGLQKIIDKMKELIQEKKEKWIFKNYRVCIILDDVIANKKFCQSKPVMKLFTMGRHLAISTIFLSQSYKNIQRACRLQANGIIYFPASQSENQRFSEECCPVGLNVREFGNMINYATGRRFNFLYINNQAPPKKKYRRNFTEQLNIGDYIGNVKDMRKELLNIEEEPLPVVEEDEEESSEEEEEKDENADDKNKKYSYDSGNIEPSVPEHYSNPFQLDF